jgi:GTP cyclohydrolase I
VSRVTPAAAVSAFLEAVEVPADPELVGTPDRVSALWRENLLAGYGETPETALGPPIPDTSGSTVTVTGIPFHGLCPHHLLPYHGVVCLAYEPAGRIAGIGRLERVVACLSRRLVLQEALTRTLCDALMEHLGARGAACTVDAEHLCLVLQGREPRGARVHTRLFVGSLEGRYDVLPAVGQR